MSEQNSPESFNLDVEPAIHKQFPEQGTAPSKRLKKKKKNKKKRLNENNVQTISEATQASLSALDNPQAEPLALNDDNGLQSLPAQPQTILNLPVKPDEWFIKPATYDENQNLLTEETFIFLQNGIEIISLPLTEDNFSTLSVLLNEKFNTLTNTEADRFHIRKPLSEEEESNPVMTLTQRNRILATTVLDQKTLKQLIRALQSQVIQKSPIADWLFRWWRKHKIIRVLLIIAAIPLAAVFLYTVYWGMTH